MLRAKLTPLNILCAVSLAAFGTVVILLIVSDLAYLRGRGMGLGDVLGLLRDPSVLRAMRMSVATSLTTLVLILLTAVPVGYALSRFSFPGKALANSIVEAPIVLPPVVIGISLLAFFNFGPGVPIKEFLSARRLTLASGFGIVLCQYLVSVSYCIRSSKIAFDGVPSGYEDVARTLGCSQWQAFWRVSLPLARNGILAGGLMGWARGLGVFGPLMVFIGTGPRVMVMPTKLWLELSVGNIEVSVAIALVMLALSLVALVTAHRLIPEGYAL
ncbi:MAG: ABC transporter permease [Lentisphaeria bacterium]|nr:ABC transporter permease [Lentisphaeria bacterium]